MDIAGGDEIVERWPTAWFFIPLPHALGLDDGHIIEMVREPSVEDLEERGRAAFLDVSLVVHQDERDGSRVAEDLAALFRLAEGALGLQEASGLPHDGDAGDLSTGMESIPAFRRRVTVMEAAVPLPASANDEDVSDVFDSALEAVRQVQRAYAAVVQRPVPLVTLSNLPPFLPMAKGSLDFLAGEPPQHDELLPFGLGPSQVALEIGEGPLDDRLKEAFGQVLHEFSAGSAFAPYAELRREAWVQRDYEGNTRVAVMLAGTSGEVFLDTLLLHLMWEESTSPEEAAQVFEDRQWHRTRVLSEYHPRLGGLWRDVGAGAVARYLSEVVQLRHRVVHAGYEPSRDEMHAAFAVMNALEKYTGDLLASGRGQRKYPRTGMAWLGNRGFEQRHAWTRRMQEITRDESEPNWILTFARWRFFVDREMNPNAPVPGRSADDVILFVDLAADGIERWVLYDERTRHAAVVDGRAMLSERETDIVEAMVGAIAREAQRHEQQWIRLARCRSLPSRIEWVPDYKVMPESGIYLP
ncbi:MAG: hypothetical protein M3N28_04560 [Actinomycetota bacterium]|nr:hypothetical protein [Actinomycetota bacterium]